MSILTNLLVLLTTTIYHIIATGIDNRRNQPPGQLIDIGGYKIHLYSLGRGNLTVVLDPSLDGIEGSPALDNHVAGNVEFGYE